jgi:DNA-binding Lrp family transcriptional regulator
MTHKRNTSGLKSTAGKKKEVALKETDEAIKRLVKTEKPINFNTVAEEAGVSKAWLYKETEVSERIKRLREKSSSKKPSTRTTTSKVGDASKDALIATLKARVKELESENSDLKKQLEVVYGKLHDATM